MRINWLTAWMDKFLTQGRTNNRAKQRSRVDVFMSLSKKLLVHNVEVVNTIILLGLRLGTIGRSHKRAEIFGIVEGLKLGALITLRSIFRVRTLAAAVSTTMS